MKMFSSGQLSRGSYLAQMGAASLKASRESGRLEQEKVPAQQVSSVSKPVIGQLSYTSSLDL